MPLQRENLMKKLEVFRNCEKLTSGFFFAENEETVSILEKCTSEESLQKSKPVLDAVEKTRKLIQHLREKEPNRIWIENQKYLVWDYHLYLFEIPHKDLKPLNDLYKKLSKHFKEREFLWIKSTDLIENKTIPLFSRVSSISDINKTFESIRNSSLNK